MTVATVDHGLRSESRAEAERVARWAEDIALPHRLLSWLGNKPKTRIQEAAREARYGLLLDLARELGASHILTGHTLDDQIETIVMRLVRGSGISGLKGMSETLSRQGIVIARPFLALRKRRLIATCQAEGWPFLSDPSNENERFARPRLRRILPILEREGLTAKRLEILAGRIARADLALSAQAEAVLASVTCVREEGRLVLDGAQLQREHDEIVIRVLEGAIAQAVRPAKPIRLEALEKLTSLLQHSVIEHG
jgi:tRNA(Ile)-lysidine synthase